MTLQDRLQQAVSGLPEGASVSLPVSAVRQWLEEAGQESEEKARADLTVTEVADRLDRKESTVRGYLGRGELRGYKFRGREWRVPEEALRSFLDSERNGGGEEGPRTVRGRGDDDLSAWREERS